MIQLTCNCGQSIQVEDGLAGREIVCPQCKKKLTVPASNQSVYIIEAKELQAVEPVPEDKPSPPAAKKKRRKPPPRREANDIASSVLKYVGITLAVLSVGAAVGFGLFFGACCCGRR